MKIVVIVGVICVCTCVRVSFVVLVVGVVSARASERLFFLLWVPEHPPAATVASSGSSCSRTVSAATKGSL